MAAKSLHIPREKEHQVLSYSNDFGKTFLGVRFRAFSLKEHSHTAKVRWPDAIGFLDANGRMPMIACQAALGRKHETVNFSLCHKIPLTSLSIDCGTAVQRNE